MVDRFRRLLLGQASVIAAASFVLVAAASGLAETPRDERTAGTTRVDLPPAERQKAEAEVKAAMTSIRRAPADADAWLALGTAAERLGRRADAFLSYARFLTLEPETPRAIAPSRSLAALLYADAPKEPPGPNQVILPDLTGGRDSALSVAAAQRYLEEWRDLSEAAFFPRALESVVASLAERRDPENDFWLPCALEFFLSAERVDQLPVLAYDIRRASGDPETLAWLKRSAAPVQEARAWARAYRAEQCVPATPPAAPPRRRPRAPAR